MKINNVSLNQKEAENMIQAINYAFRNNGEIEMEIETRYFAGYRNVHAIVHIARGWDKEFNLTSGAVTNIADQDGDHDNSTLTRIERIISRLESLERISISLDQLITRQQKTLQNLEDLKKFF